MSTDAPALRAVMSDAIQSVPTFSEVFLHAMQELETRLPAAV